MSIGIARLTAFVIIVAATASLLIGTGTVIEQFAKAQNMTTNTTDSAGNMTGTDDSGSISAKKGGRERAMG
jgi:archaellin